MSTPYKPVTVQQCELLKQVTLDEITDGFINESNELTRNNRKKYTLQAVELFYVTSNADGDKIEASIDLTDMGMTAIPSISFTDQQNLLLYELSQTASYSDINKDPDNPRDDVAREHMMEILRTKIQSLVIKIKNLPNVKGKKVIRIMLRLRSIGTRSDVQFCPTVPWYVSDIPERPKIIDVPKTSNPEPQPPPTDPLTEEEIGDLILPGIPKPAAGWKIEPKMPKTGILE